jgi:anti-sigma regulatory factor (Ser/Thr protein kinase)
MTVFLSALPRAAESVRAARQVVEIHGGRLSETQREDAGLMVSELVTNALIHGRGAITIRITPGLEDLTIEVADEGHGKVRITPDPGALGGWGLRVVDELADTWGASNGSTRVWFRLRLGRPAAGDGSGHAGRRVLVADRL